MKIVISIPAYNEEKSIARVLREIRREMNSTNYSYKLLILDDGSTDNTVKIAKKEGVVVKSNKVNLGLAKTFNNEMKECLKLKADIIVHTDADGQYPARYIPEMINKVTQGYDLVIGSRFGKGRYQGSLMKKIGNMMFAKVFSNLLKTKISDTTTGFRAFTKKVAEIPLINNFTYTQEQLIRVGKSGFKLSEIPIKTNKTRESRLFKNSFDYAFKAWVNIFRIYRDFEPLKFFGKIGLIFFTVGIAIGTWLVYLYVTTRTIGGHTAFALLSMLLITIGIQITLFGFLADMIRR